MDRDLRYAAKSTQDAKGSTDRQHQRMEAAIHAEGREPYGRPYVDEAKSGYHGNRGQDLDAVMAEAERLVAEGDHVRLWFDHSDRSSRGDGVEARHTVEVMLWALKAGVELRSVRDPDTFRSLSSAASMGDRNHGDSKVKAERVAEGHAERRAAGGYHGGPPAYGYSFPVDPDQPTRTMPDGSVRPNTRPWLPLELHADQVPVVRRMAQLVLEGNSLKATARLLNADGVPTVRAGRRWHGESIGRILGNPIYKAQARSGAKLAHEPILDADTWQRVQDVLAQRAKGGASKGGRPTRQPALFLNGHLRCGQCGSAMGYRLRRKPSGHTSERYVCAGREESAAYCAQGPVPVAAVEGAVLEAFRQRALGQEGSLAAFQAGYQADLTHVEALRKGAEHELAKAEGALARVRADYKAGELTAAEWRELRTELEEELMAAQAQADLMGERERLTRLRASDQLQDAFTGALIALGHAADQALRGELPLDGVRDALRALFPTCTWRQADGQAHVDLGEPVAERVALRLDDELPGREGEPLVDRGETTATVGLPSVAVIAPILVEL
jgi:DNA invertase Pin-like site-specific DNA recombinase